jgi:hypothetical protein
MIKFFELGFHLKCFSEGFIKKVLLRGELLFIFKGLFDLCLKFFLEFIRDFFSDKEFLVLDFFFFSLGNINDFFNDSKIT